MFRHPQMDIVNSYGHYTLYINGQFFGNYDTMKEARDEYDNEVLMRENEDSERISED